MRRWLLAALYLYVLAGLAQTVPAQSIVVPQSCPAPMVATGFDASGTIQCRQISQADLVSPFARTTSSSTITLDATNPQPVSIVLDNASGFLPGYVTLLQAVDDDNTWGYCVITATDSDNGITCLPTAMNGGGTSYSAWKVAVVLGPAIAGVPTWAGLGFDSTTPITIPANAGVTVTLQISGGNAIGPNSVIYVFAAQSNIGDWFTCTVQTVSAGAVNCLSGQTSGSGNTWRGYYASIVDLGGQDAYVTAYSQSNNTIPSSLPSANLTFTPPSGVANFTQYMPLQGHVLITCLTNTNWKMTGQIVAYPPNGTAPATSLIITVTSVLAGGGNACSAWSLFMNTDPTTRIPKYSMQGLQITQSGFTATININAGSVRNVKDTMDLVLPAKTTIDLSATTNLSIVAKAGTISSSGATVTGVGTTFTTDFQSAKCNDYNDQRSALNQSFAGGPNVTISTATQASGVNTITNDLSLTTFTNLGAGAGTAYNRNGPINTNNTGTGISYCVGLAYNPTTGVVDRFATSATPSGEPDLPAGYTEYRIIGKVVIVWTGSQYSFQIIDQPMQTFITPLNKEGDMIYFHLTKPFQLGVGAANTVLQSNGTDPIYATVPNAALVNSSITLNAGTNVGLTAPGAMALGSTNTIGATTDTPRFAGLGLGGAANTRALRIYGSTSGSLDVDVAAAAGTNSKITFPGGTTDFSATGAASNVVKQVSSGAAFTVGQLACADLSDAADGCKNNGANPTATAGAAAVNGTAKTYMRSDGAPALPVATGAAQGIAQFGTGLAVSAGNVTVSLSTATNVLGADVSLNNTANYFDGPSMAQGTSGTWWVSGSVTLTDTLGTAAIECKLWDGTTTILSGRIQVAAANGRQVVTLAGFLASPAANIRISCKDITSTSGKILFNDSGNSKDSGIFGFRIN